MSTIALCLSTTAARAEIQTFDYQFAWGHLTLGEAEVAFSQSDSSYRLSGSMKTQGILDFFFSWQGRAETEGVRRADGRQPRIHQHSGSWNDNTRWTRVQWDDAALPRADTRPPPDAEIVTPVPEASVVGTSDPFTVLLTILDQLARSGRCDAQAKVWDGRRRYDLAVTYLGEETLIADRPWAYEGAAVKCALTHERIGGFWRDGSRWREQEDGTSLGRVVWAAEVAPERWVLVRAEVETPYGTVVGRLLPEGGLDRDGGSPHTNKAALTD